MIIEKTINGKELTFRLFGKLDTTTAPMLHAELTEALAKEETLILDLADLAHLSSAGLRVLLYGSACYASAGKNDC